MPINLCTLIKLNSSSFAICLRLRLKIEINNITAKYQYIQSKGRKHFSKQKLASFITLNRNYKEFCVHTQRLNNNIILCSLIIIKSLSFT